MNTLIVLALLTSLNYGEKITYTPPLAHEIIRAYEMQYNISPDSLYDTYACESNLNPKALNATDGVGGSRGIGQFQTATFKKYAPLAGIEHADIWNPIQQIQTGAYMFSIGEARQWSCYKGDKQE